jgi:hypothetical protein
MAGSTPTTGTAGVYYDDTYNPNYLRPAPPDCSIASRGSEISWTEAADRSDHRLAGLLAATDWTRDHGRLPRPHWP